MRIRLLFLCASALSATAAGAMPGGPATHLLCKPAVDASTSACEAQGEKGRYAMTRLRAYKTCQHSDRREDSCMMENFSIGTVTIYSDPQCTKRVAAWNINAKACGK